MSHIPNSVMKHAGPVHHDDAPPATVEQPATPSTRGLGTGAWLAIGGTIVASAVAAIAVPLLRGREEPRPTRRGKAANSGK
jgi:hypothetical protein